MAESLIERALNPKQNVIIEACAGSGKTWLLVSRIIRLLLAGTPPSEILAISFTRKAAGEMRERLREWLGNLLFDSDEKVIAFLMQRGMPEYEARDSLPQARGLFELVLNAQPEIAILTFDSWFERITRHAPLAAGMRSPNFAENTSVLVENAWQRFTDGLQGSPESALAQDLLYLFKEYGLTSTKKLLNNFIKRRLEWWQYTLGEGDAVSYTLAQLEGAQAVAFDLDDILLKRIEQYAGLLQKNTDTHVKRAKLILTGLNCADSQQRFEQISAAIFKAAGEPYKLSPSAKQRERLGADGEAQLLALHDAICKRIGEIKQKCIEHQIYLVNQAGLRCGTALLEIFQALKTERGVVDYNDLIWRAHVLLSQSEHAEYVQYKLGDRYRHVLLDEFQDTNPLQWQVLKIWLDESLAVDQPVGVFLVGDPKQSIYRFRGADSRLFEVASEYLQSKFNAIFLPQNTSWRSAPGIIFAVNAVFHEEKFPHFVAHLSAQPQLPGGAQLLVPSPKPQAPIAGAKLRNPLIEADVEAPDAYLNEGFRIADKIAAIVGQWKIMEGTVTRAADYSDVMILVTKRKHVGMYESALRAAEIPYVSSRRGALLQTLEARDLTALLRFLITPFADLDLAHILRSPIFNCTDLDLSNLAGGSEQTWWQRLKKRANEEQNGALHRAWRLLATWRDSAKWLPVHDLLDKIFFEANILNTYASAVPPSLRAAVLANLNAYMQLTLEIDSGRYPSLPKFVYELQQLDRLNKEDAPDEGVVAETQNACRILTVHGAKGLESPIVILAGTDDKPSPADSFYALVDWPPEADKPLHFSLYSKKAQRGQARAAYFMAEDQACEREHLNLLYVAMTRAKQVLIVSAATEKSGGWYEKIAARIFPSADLEQQTGMPACDSPCTFSALSLSHPAVGKKESALSPVRRYGIQLHALLEQLAMPNPLSKQYLKEKLGSADTEFEALWSSAQTLLHAPHLQRFFDPQQYVNAHNELSFFCAAEGQMFRVDRLVEFTDSVWVLDYKSGQPESANYAAQMSAYRNALIAVFPHKPIHCALLWRDGVLQEC
mgnify:CR=1 FL=1